MEVPGASVNEIPRRGRSAGVGRVGGVAPGGQRRLAAQEFGLDRTGHPLRDLVLGAAKLIRAELEALGPQLVRCRCVDQLRRDAHLLRALAHAAFQRVAHAKLLGHLLRPDRAALEGEARVAADDVEPAKARQRDDDVFGDAIDEVVTLGSAAHGDQRQNDDAGLAGRRAPPRRMLS